MTVRRAADALEYPHIHPTTPPDLQKSSWLTMIRRWLRVSQESPESQGHRMHEYIATRGRSSSWKVPSATLITAAPRQLALQSLVPVLMLVTDSVKCRLSFIGLIARCDAHARAVHHSGPAAIETIHKDSGRTLRCIVLAFPALPNMLTHDCSPGSFLLLCSPSGIASQIHHRRAEQPRSAALAAGVLGPAVCSLWRLSSARGRVEARSFTVINFRAKWRATGRDAAALCGPGVKQPRVLEHLVVELGKVYMPEALITGAAARVCAHSVARAGERRAARARRHIPFSVER